MTTPSSEAALRQMIREAWLDGFQSSAEGWNGEYPFNDGAVFDGDNPNMPKLLEDLFAYENFVFGPASETPA